MTATLPAEATHVLKQYWGYESFLPSQEEAITSILNRQDSLVILPTGGGKSLCFQLPALLMPGLVVVISPLVALMKDQVDGLNAVGICAGFYNSSLTEVERANVVDRLRAGEYKLLYVAPERLASDGFLGLLKQLELAYFVIDEAHCISQWGHDFRPEYRMLGRLHQHFPGISVHAFTATATELVRQDMIEALQLERPNVMVGNFERPNLLYRVQHRQDTLAQVCDIVDRHPGEGGIIYCIRRADVDDLAKSLAKKGIKVLPYHAGLSDKTRQANQDAFISEQVDVVVATVAFGMGIDRSNIRYVIHTGMPKSIEHYQQEAGRAGRDRLDAECVLLFSGADVGKWMSIMGKPQSEQDQQGLQKLYEMNHYCQMATCRHRFLVEYFGQAYPKANCAQCDHCLGEHAIQEDSKTIARKILSCVARVKERFGVYHVSQVLKGANTEKIREFGHAELSTYGLLSAFRSKDISAWIEQMVYQGYLVKDPQYSTLRLTQDGVTLMRGEGDIALAQPVPRKAKEDRAEARKSARKQSSDWAGVDDALFESLRQLRRSLAIAKNVPPYVIFSDVSLREMASQKPTTSAEFRRIKGVGEHKLEEFGAQFMDVIQAVL